MAKNNKQKAVRRFVALSKIFPLLFNFVRQLWQRVRRPNLNQEMQGSSFAKDDSSRQQKKKEEAVPFPLDREEALNDRKWDYVGICLVVGGVFSLLGLFAQNDNSLLGMLLGLQQQLFGWGAYSFPFLLIGIGFWMIWRRKEKLPFPTMGRLIGLSLLWFNSLGWLHFGNNALPYFRSSSPMVLDPFSLLPEDFIPGAGGFFCGVLIYLFCLAFGLWGTVILLSAWLILALALTFDVGIAVLLKGMAISSQTIADRSVKWYLSFVKKRPMKEEPFPSSFPITSYPSRANLHRQPAASSQPLQISSPSVSVMPHWELPSYEQCLEGSELPSFEAQDESKRTAVIEETLESFGAPGKVVEVRRGPTITQFGVEPQYIETRRGRTRVRVSKIAALADDLALALAAKRIRIQAPVPGKSYVGIEVPNEQTAVVHLREVIRSQAFQRLQSPLRFALGSNVSGEPQAFDLAALPHLLIAGATGSGKSVCVNSIISCFLLFNTPQDLRLLMVDPKRVELSGYNGIPHLLAPVIVDIKQVTRALQWVTQEMDRRYHTFAETGVRNIRDYNQRIKLLAKSLKTEQANQAQPAGTIAPLPYWVVIIDELADLMMLAPDETERAITRLAQLARATGIHLILATQRPSVDVVTGVIKANFPARIAFAVASSVDSRVIIDQPGAERLLGSGDMLFQAPDAAAPLRLQGVYVSDREIQRIVQHWRNFTVVQHTSNPNERAVAEGEKLTSDMPSMPESFEQAVLPEFTEQQEVEEDDPLLDEAIAWVRQQGRASVSMLQRRLRIGYTRAARLIDLMEERGIISKPQSALGVREVFEPPQLPSTEEK